MKLLKNHPIISVVILLIAINIVGCKRMDVYEKYHKSVVMIYNKYLYKVSLNGGTLYFNYDNEADTMSNISSTLAEASANAMGDFGTGFFIDNDGKIVTNRHVVHDWLPSYEEKCKQILRDKIEQNRLAAANLKDSATNEISAWTNKYYADFSADDKAHDDEEVRAWKDIQTNAEGKVQTWETMTSALSEAKFDVQTLYMGYATDGNFVNSISDFKECQLVNYSKEEPVDLAVIQANDHKLPDGTSNYVSVDNIDNTPLKVGDEVSMIGYNLGMSISETKTGLKVQKTAGAISQESDGFRVLYSINALKGSSGSPVFSSDGKLVAVNYYGYNSQAFNYGILAKYITDVEK